MAGTHTKGPFDSEQGFSVNGTTVINSSGKIIESAGIELADGDAFLDTAGNEELVFGVTVSAVNELKVTNAAAGSAPSLKAQGGDTNVALLLAGKGTGAVQLGQTTSVGVTLVADQPILDSAANELIKFVKTTTAINEITVTNQAAGSAPSITATGGDTNIGVTLSGKGTGAVNLGQATTTGITLIADQPLLDSSSNELVKFTKVASAVNEITIGNNSTGLGPTLTASGETNVPVTLAGKGTGPVQLGQASSTDVRLVADQPIADSSGNELIKFVKTATAVNELTITNQATGSSPSIAATGGDTNINVVLTPKAQGGVRLNGMVVTKQEAPAAKTTSTTLTTAEIAKFIITVNQGGAATSALQLPLASSMDTDFATLTTDDSIDVSIINISTVDAEDASITTNTGWTLVGSMDFHAYSAAGSLNSSGVLRLRKTGTGAWTAYRIS